MPEYIPKNNSLIWHALLVLGVLTLALAGYLGYVVYPRFDLPSVTGSGLLILAAAAGMASFFSPCSFPLLLTLLSREIIMDKQEKKVPLGRPLSFAAALSAGATLFLLLVGTTIALGGGPLFAQVTFISLAGRIIRLVISALLILLGLIQLEVIPITFHGVENLARPLLKYQGQLRREHPTLAFAIFGFAYLIAGFGWTGPILAGLASHAFTVGGSLAAFIAFVVAAFALTILMFVLSFAIALAQDRLVDTLRTSVVSIKKWGGRILILVGLWLMALAVFAQSFARLFPV